MRSKKVLITGIAGFIGFHAAQALATNGWEVIGIDNFNDYYNPLLKRQRAAILHTMNISIIEGDIATQGLVDDILQQHPITHILHLAAQAGVRYSLTHPHAYVRNNIDGFLHILEAVRKHPEIHLVYASSSSVYGLNEKIPFSIDDTTDKPANFYGVTKKTNELMAYTYHHLYKLSIIGLRFFTVYGPWGRPDMAYFHFTKAISSEEPITVYNHGNMRRDFTYIDDIVQGITAALSLNNCYHVFNLGNEHPQSVMYLIELIENFFGKKASINYVSNQKGEIPETFADIQASTIHLQYRPKISLQEGMHKFLEWYDKNKIYS